jgi:hypothetical protein
MVVGYDCLFVDVLYIVTRLKESAWKFILLLYYIS